MGHTIGLRNGQVRQYHLLLSIPGADLLRLGRGEQGLPETRARLAGIAMVLIAGRQLAGDRPSLGKFSVRRFVNQELADPIAAQGDAGHGKRCQRLVDRAVVVRPARL